MTEGELAKLLDGLPKDNEGAVSYEDIVLALNITEAMKEEK